MSDRARGSPLSRLFLLLAFLLALSPILPSRALGLAEHPTIDAMSGASAPAVAEVEGITPFLSEPDPATVPLNASLRALVLEEHRATVPQEAARLQPIVHARNRSSTAVPAPPERSFPLRS